MAITQTTIGINTANAGTWANRDVILQFEKAFEVLGWHGETKTGFCAGLSTYSGGGFINQFDQSNYQDVEPIATTGIGTGASFYVDRQNGSIRSVHVNRPGFGYTGGEVVTLPASSIGGSANGATNMQVRVAVAATVSNSVGYAVTFVSEYFATGTDRNGTVLGQAATITIKEGDTLTITNNQSSSSYRINIIYSFNGDNTTGAGDTNRVFNVSGQNNNNTSGGQTTWTPLPGQSGTYFVRPDFSFSYSNTIPKIVVLPADSADINYIGVGSTSSFYDKVLEASFTGPDSYGVLRHTIQSGKKYGDTYRAIQMRNEEVGRLYFSSGSGYLPINYSPNASYNGGQGFPNRFAGSANLDIALWSIFSSESSMMFVDNSYRNSPTPASSTIGLSVGTNTQYQLDLNIFRSSLDPKFAVFSFKAPTKSSSHIRDNTFSTFFFHNFTTDIWDLDDVFLGGFTQILCEGFGNTGFPNIQFVTYMAGTSWNPNSSGGSGWVSKRTAEYGYAPQNTDSNSGDSDTYVTSFSQYFSTTYPYAFNSNANRIYYRNSNNLVRSRGGYTTGNQGSQSLDSISSDANFNAVIKGIPLNSNFIPCPYYLPDDFVLIDFDYGVPSANIQQGDTITISGSEVYTVINGSYNNNNANRTRGILFCARTV